MTIPAGPDEDKDKRLADWFLAMSPKEQEEAVLRVLHGLCSEGRVRNEDDTWSALQ